MKKILLSVFVFVIIGLLGSHIYAQKTNKYIRDSTVIQLSDTAYTIYKNIDMAKMGGRDNRNTWKTIWSSQAYISYQSKQVAGLAKMLDISPSTGKIYITPVNNNTALSHYQTLFANQLETKIHNYEALKMGGRDNYLRYQTIYQSPEFVKYQKKQSDGAIEMLTSANNPSTANTQTVDNTAKDEFAQFAKGQLSSADMSKILSYPYARGSTGSHIVIVEYTDVECPFCIRHSNDKTLAKVVANYSGKVSIISKVVAGVNHTNTKYKSLAILCAGQLGGSSQYYAMIDAIMSGSTIRSALAIDKVIDIAKGLGLDQTKLEACISDAAVEKMYDANRSEAQSLGANGTPGNIIIDTRDGTWRLVAGAYPASEFIKLIDYMLR